MTPLMCQQEFPVVLLLFAGWIVGVCSSWDTETCVGNSIQDVLDLKEEKYPIRNIAKDYHDAIEFTTNDHEWSFGYPPHALRAYKEACEALKDDFFWMEVNGAIELRCDMVDMNIRGRTTKFYGLGECLSKEYTSCSTMEPMDLLRYFWKYKSIDSCYAPDDADESLANDLVTANGDEEFISNYWDYFSEDESWFEEMKDIFTPVSVCFYEGNSYMYDSFQSMFWSAKYQPLHEDHGNFYEVDPNNNYTDKCFTHYPYRLVSTNHHTITRNCKAECDAYNESPHRGVVNALYLEMGKNVTIECLNNRYDSRDDTVVFDGHYGICVANVTACRNLTLLDAVYEDVRDKSQHYDNCSVIEYDGEESHEKVIAYPEVKNRKGSSKPNGMILGIALGGIGVALLVTIIITKCTPDKLKRRKAAANRGNNDGMLKDNAANNNVDNDIGIDNDKEDEFHNTVGRGTEPPTIT